MAPEQFLAVFGGDSDKALGEAKEVDAAQVGPAKTEDEAKSDGGVSV